jgi:hypothetical protein
MRKLNQLLSLAFVISCISTSFSQEVPITKRNVSKIFGDMATGKVFDYKKKIRDDHYNRLNLEKYDHWETCNDDSLYYHSDTITFFNYPTENDLICSKEKYWNVCSRKFTHSKRMMGSCGNNGVTRCNYYSIKKHNEEVLISFIDENNLVNVFEIYSITKLYRKVFPYLENEVVIEPYYIMTVVRCKN